MNDCACTGTEAAISFRDYTNMNIMTFVRLCSGQYFGGRKHDAVSFVPGAQMWLTLGGMFDLIARLANNENADKGLTYSMVGGSWSAMITREMQAPDVAKVLGCDEQAVLDYFRLLIKVTPEPVL